MYWWRTKKAQYPDGAVAPKTALPYGSDSWITWNRCHLRHTRCQKLFLFPQAVAQQKKKAELFYKERLGVLAARCASCISMTNF